MQVALNVPDTAAQPGQTLTFPERVVTPVPASAPADEPAPAVPGEKLLTMECVIPETHMPGQKLVWVSPFGLKVTLNPGPRRTLSRISSSNAIPNPNQVALTLPETAKPGQTLEFQIPASIVHGRRCH